MSKYSVFVGDVNVEALLNKIGGVEAARLLLDGHWEVRPLGCNFPVFKTIRRDLNLKSSEDYCQVLKAEGMELTPNCWTDDMIHHEDFLDFGKEEEIDIIMVTPLELGFKGGRVL